MGVLKNLTQLSENLGAGTADFSDLLAEQVRLFSCSLWESFPDQITKNSNLRGSFTRGFMNRMCRDQTLPAPPVTMMEQGKCPTSYFWRPTMRVSRPNSALGLSIGDEIVVQAVANQNGPIDSTEYPPVPNNAFVVGKANGPNFNPQTSFQFMGITVEWRNPPDPADNPSLVNVNEIVSDSFIRVDGMPDNCGMTTIEYPDTTPTAMDYETTININSEDGDTLTFPLIYAPIDFSFPLNFDLGGINLTVDLGGINFNFSLVSIDGLPIPLPDGQDAPLPSPQDDGNRNVRCKRKPAPGSGSYNQDDKTETDPKEEDVGDTLEFVRVTLTSVPTNVKNQFGDGAPDVIYAGWFEFQGEGFNFPRQPIHFTNSLFIPPEGSTGYAYTLYEGIQGKATVYTTKEEA